MFLLAAGSSAVVAAAAAKPSVEAEARPEPTPAAKPVEAKPITAWDARDIAGELQQKLARQGFHWE